MNYTERCARICDEIASTYREASEEFLLGGAIKMAESAGVQRKAAENCAAAIRALEVKKERCSHCSVDYDGDAHLPSCCCKKVNLCNCYH